jgi:hypothetical protein
MPRGGGTLLHGLLGLTDYSVFRASLQSVCKGSRCQPFCVVLLAHKQNTSCCCPCPPSAKCVSARTHTYKHAYAHAYMHARTHTYTYSLLTAAYWCFVCSDDNIGPVEARVACRQLGFNYGQMLGPSDAGMGGSPPQGRGFWMSDVNCRGDNQLDRLTQCTFSGWGGSGCDAQAESLALLCGEDVRLVISPPPPSPPPVPFACECTWLRADRALQDPGFGFVALSQAPASKQCAWNHLRLWIARALAGHLRH